MPGQQQEKKKTQKRPRKKHPAYKLGNRIGMDGKTQTGSRVGPNNHRKKIGQPLPRAHPANTGNPSNKQYGQALRDRIANLRKWLAEVEAYHKETVSEDNPGGDRYLERKLLHGKRQLSQMEERLSLATPHKRKTHRGRGRRK